MKYIKISLQVIAALSIIIACSGDNNADDSAMPTNGNKLNLGASANDLLSEATYDELVLELAFVNGFKPEPASITALTTFLNERLNKPGGITVVERELPPQEVGFAYSIEEVRQIEDNFRTQFNSGNKIAVFILFVDLDSQANSGNSIVLGTAYRNTSLVMFQKTIQNFSGGINEPSRTALETAVYEHEFSHILGLVNIGTPLQSSHEDTANRGHCNVADCLMQARLEGGNIADMMGMISGGVPVLDAQCIADLRANGGK